MTWYVCDVGNSRMKWGRCTAEAVVEIAALPLELPEAWEGQFQAWKVPVAATWYLAGVNPVPLGSLAQWLAVHGQQVRHYLGPAHLPLRLDVETPEAVGVDRLLNALAAWKTAPASVPAVLVDAGSAVTVDLLDAPAVFRGGAILPGLRLLAQALHSYTARLPLVQVDQPQPAVPGRSTAAAIRAGIYDAVVGGIVRLVHRYQQRFPLRRVWLTGGDAALLRPALEPWCQEHGLPLHLWPEMTLEGLRLAAAEPGCFADSPPA